MPTLGMFIGALLTDSVQARVRADMESLKIAEAYSRHDLLKHMPVPRFRLPDITIDFPVIVSSLQEGELVGGGRLFDEPTRLEIQKTVRAALLESGIRLTNSERGQVYTAVERRA